MFHMGGVSPILDSTSLFVWLLAPLSTPAALKVLQAVDSLSHAQKLDLQSYLRLHLVSQLQQFDSWPHAVTAIGSVAAAQQTVLPACPPLTADQQEHKRRRQAIASLKRLPTRERWGPLVTTAAGFREAPLVEAEALSAPKPISVSQLSRTHQRIPESFWEKLIEAVLAEITTAMTPGVMPDVGPVRAVDASVFRVPESFQWATYKDGLQAAKILVEYDVVSGLVKAPILTEGSVHEARTGRTLPKQPGTTYLIDRGFWAFTDFDDYCHKGIYFVTRCKENAQIARLTSYPVPPDSAVIADEEVVLGRGIKRMEHSVRLVTVSGEDGTPVQFVTNRFDLPAHLIGQLYRNRWQIELFFRWLKHHFKTLHFFGHSRQAVYAQIAAAFLAHILLVHRYRQLRYRGGLLEFARRVEVGLFAPVPTAWVRIAS